MHPAESANLSRHHTNGGKPSQQAAREFVGPTRIRCGKQTGLGNFPFRGFQSNAAWLELALIAHDLLAWTKRLLLEGELARWNPNGSATGSCTSPAG